MTVQQLLEHTAGGWPNDGTDPMFKNKSWTLCSRICSREGKPHARGEGLDGGVNRTNFEPLML